MKAFVVPNPRFFAFLSVFAMAAQKKGRKFSSLLEGESSPPLCSQMSNIVKPTPARQAHIVY